LKKLTFDFDFADLAIKGRSSQGNIMSKNAVKKIIQAEKGFSTLGARDIWYDDTVMRLNTDDRGKYLGAFKEDDRILTLMKSGHYRLMSFDLSNHFEEDIAIIEKFNPNKPVTAIYYNQVKNTYFAKRFLVETTDKKSSFLPEDEGTRYVTISTDYRPVLKVEFNNEGQKKPVETPQVVELETYVELMGVKAKGKRIGTVPVQSVEWLEALPYEESIEETELDSGDEENEGDIPEEIQNEIETTASDDVVIPARIDESSIKPPPDFPDDEDGTPVQMTLF